ncbi:MAG TPA: ribosome-associated translation inhibitor RaiA, partial [Vicinamibacterales bacterium]|nr:ribosome-associated translation inhibitor RaiA [Vicinamibacterales bacterium]
MRLELTGRHVDITPALRRLVTAKLSRLERMLNHRAVSAQAVLSREKHSVRADITLHARGEKFLHGVGNADGWETSIGEAIDKISQQAQRVKSKFTNHKRRGAKGAPIIGEAREAAVVRPAGPPPAAA